MASDKFMFGTGIKLAGCAYRGNLDEVKRIIEEKADPDDWSGTSMPAIVAASVTKSSDVVKFLLEKNANPNNYTENKLSALKTAAAKGHSDIVEMLLEAKADPNYENNGEIALTLACDDHTDLNLLKLLLPVSDKKYYQKAYNYCTIDEMRRMIKQAAPEINFVDPIDGFGGPYYKMKMRYDKVPTDPLLEKIYKLLNLVSSRDPNEQFFIVMYQMDLCDNPDKFYRNGELFLSEKIKLILLSVLDDLDDQTPYQDLIEIIQHSTLNHSTKSVGFQDDSR